MQTVKKHWKLFLAGSLTAAGIFFSPHLISRAQYYHVNHQFEAFTDALFSADVCGNALNLHYILANPEDLGITDYRISLGSFHPSQIAVQRITCENRLCALQSYDPEYLSLQNRLTRDILLLFYETELMPGNQYLFSEVLSPSLGNQAQLPILLAEYTFRQETDIQNYLKILASVDTYFDGILSFEQLKSQNGTFMSDVTADRIIQQCSSFIEHPDDNYLKSVFTDKISDFPGLSEQKKEAYENLHEKIIDDQVLPAYQSLIDGIYLLKGTGKNPDGLCGFPGGKAYYEYLLKSTCGVYESVSDIQTRLLQQLEQDMAEYSSLLSGQQEPTLQAIESTSAILSEDPEQMLLELQNHMQSDFPAAPDTSWQIKYVPSDLEEYLSPAFYLTPPIDTMSPNDIYLNRHADMSGMTLFTTLAHEGFPGHLYQTITFSASNPSPVRHTLSMGGYVEGWATYVETYAYGYADTNPDLTRMAWLNRSVNLCLLSLMDIGIHYNGWDNTRCRNFLTGFGITDPQTQDEIRQTIIEDPANYLKYYLGYLHFLDLKESQKQELGENLNLKEFHRKILTIGPCQFPVLEKYIDFL